MQLYLLYPHSIFQTPLQGKKRQLLVLLLFEKYFWKYWLYNEELEPEKSKHIIQENTNVHWRQGKEKKNTRGQKNPHYCFIKKN